MKQITIKQAEILACADNRTLKLEIEYCQADWIRHNARQIADIESKRTDKTFFGTWPKGWRNAMKVESVKQAKDDLMKRFIAKECLQLDGVLWLGNLFFIAELERGGK